MARNLHTVRQWERGSGPAAEPSGETLTAACQHATKRAAREDRDMVIYARGDKVFVRPAGDERPKGSSKWGRVSPKGAF